MSAEAQRIGQRIRHLFFVAVPTVIQIQFPLRLTQSHGTVDIAFLNFFYAGDEFHRSCRSQEMSHHGFGGIDLQIIRMFPKCKLDSSGLEQVIMMGTGSMGINISKLLRCHTAVFQGVQHGGSRPAAVLRRGGDVIGIRRTAVAGQLRIDLRSASLCMLQFFQYHYRRAFSHNEAITVFIKRNRSSLRVFTK